MCPRQIHLASPPATCSITPAGCGSWNLCAEQYFAGLRGLLETGGDVDGAAGDERLAAAGHDFAGVDADP